MTASYDEQLEQRIFEFEKQWQAAPPADLRRQLEELRNDEAKLFEMLTIDIEYRWRSKRGSLCDELGGQPRIEDYIRFARSLQCELSVSMDWIAEEYRVRHGWGDQPSIEHYLGRFPEQSADELERLLAYVASELSREYVKTATLEVGYDQRAPLRYEDFKILQHIGAGVSARVYRAKQISLDRTVALKALHKSLQHDDWAIDVFLREGKILAGLEHPGIARLFGMGRFPGGGYFQIQELVDGTNLRDWLRERNEIDDPEVIRIIRSVAASIAYAHEHSVVHCDLKPENILISNDRIVIADFGMAALVGRNRDSKSESIGGTPKYMAPELSTEPPTKAADVYALGVIWQELDAFIQRDPDTRNSMQERCVSPDPELRPTAAELVESLSAI